MLAVQGCQQSPRRTRALGEAARTRRLIGGLLTGALLVVAGMLGTGVETAAGRPADPCGGAKLHPDDSNGAAVAHATLCLIDEIRAASELHRLHANDDLRAVAAAQVTEMVRRDYFADDRPSGQTPLALIASTPYAAHAASLSTAQNIGWATGADVTPLSMVAAWMRSAPHRAIILTPGYWDIGIGVAATLPPSLGRGRTGAVYAVEFGARVLEAPSRAPARIARDPAGLRAGL